MKIEFEAFSPEELVLAANFISQLAAMQRARMQPKDGVGLSPEYVDNINRVGTSKPGSVVGGIATWPKYQD